MSKKKTAEQKIIEKHTEALHRGFQDWPTLEFGLPPTMFEDKRWTPELILSTWIQAQTGNIPDNGLEYRIGDSGGGFDVLDFNFLPEEQWTPKNVKIDTSLVLNKRNDGLAIITIPVPFYGAAMSFGSISLNTMLSKAMAAYMMGTFSNTGEGGYPDELIPYKDHVITQVATGLFGVKEETIQRARIVDLKYAQAAKPGLGGHLLGDKVTLAVAEMRESVPWISALSPFPFHSVYSVEDHKKHIDWIKQINPRALVSTKVSTTIDIDMVASGSYDAGTHVLNIDGGYGGTGAAPDIAKKNIAMPTELAIPRVHKHLVQEETRNNILLIASGGIRTAYDGLKAIALGADGWIIGTAELVAIGCTRCANCERGRGCPFGITTTDPELSQLITPEWGSQQILNLYKSHENQIIDACRKLGLTKVTDLRGRTDLLKYCPERKHK
ncbi:glutamate synthase-related protein [Patescibacteria group bacterium AH-259-L05]|nr:glutamate synthase-related protein [Patescibacteria group bacterium AH-259-L05]